MIKFQLLKKKPSSKTNNVDRLKNVKLPVSNGIHIYSKSIPIPKNGSTHTLSKFISFEYSPSIVFPLQSLVLVHGMLIMIFRPMKIISLSVHILVIEDFKQVIQINRLVEIIPSSILLSKHLH